MTDKPMFADCKIGDEVWCIRNGWGNIEEIKEGTDYSLKIRFKDNDTSIYTLDGKLTEWDYNPILFWDEVKITPPERPCLGCKQLKERGLAWNNASLHTCYAPPKKPDNKCKDGIHVYHNSVVLAVGRCECGGSEAPAWQERPECDKDEHVFDWHYGICKICKRKVGTKKEPCQACEWLKIIDPTHEGLTAWFINQHHTCGKGKG